MAHPQRLKILTYLCEGEKTVTQLQDYCNISQSNVSQFLNKMRSHKLVDFRRESKDTTNKEN